MPLSKSALKKVKKRYDEIERVKDKIKKHEAKIQTLLDQIWATGYRGELAVLPASTKKKRIIL